MMLYRYILHTRPRAIKCTDCISANEYPGYDTKQSDGEVPVMPVLWGMQSVPSLLSLIRPLRTGVVALDRVLSMSQIELKCVFMLN